MRQIIAMGGGGFSMEPDNLLLDQYVLQQSTEPRPKVCFIPTASGDSESYIQRFYEAFAQLNCIPSHLSLFRPPADNLEQFILAQDILYVGGGSTKNMLVLWREWGLDRALRTAWERGKVLAGISAGSICWFEEGVTDSYFGSLTGISALGFLPGSNCPHYDGEGDRRPAFHQLLASGQMGDGYAADDGVALHYVDTRLQRIVSSRPKAKAYYVSQQSGLVKEEVVDPVYLGQPN